MSDISCTDRIRMLSDLVSNVEEAAEWREFHFREEIRSLQLTLVAREGEILELKEELRRALEYGPEVRQEVSLPEPQPLQRSVLRIICNHIFRTRAPQVQQVEEDLG